MKNKMLARVALQRQPHTDGSYSNPLRRRRCRRAGAGFTTLLVLFIASIALMAVLAMASASSFQVRSSRRAQDRVTGLILAEAGIDDVVDRMQSNIHAGGNTGTLYEDPPYNTRPFGTFHTTVTALDAYTTRRVVSTGTNRNGTKYTVEAILVQEEMPLGKVALMANGPIHVSGTATVTTEPADLHIADIYANWSVQFGGSSFVDGKLLAGGEVTGEAYYPSVSYAPPFPYPSTAQADQWKADWITRAKAGGTIRAVQGKGNTTITAPKYIDGNLALQNDEEVTFNGPGIIFVDGNVTLSGSSRLTNGVTLVVNGTFSQTGTATYQITTPALGSEENPTLIGSNPTPTLVVYGTGRSSTANVVQLGGGATGVQQGIVYAASGSIAVAGGATFTGALIATGPGASITCNGNYTHVFPKDMYSEVKFPNGVYMKNMVEL